MSPATTPSTVKGSISKWVVSEPQCFSYSAIRQLFSSLTSRYSTRPRRSSSVKPHSLLLICRAIVLTSFWNRFGPPAHTQSADDLHFLKVFCGVENRRSFVPADPGPRLSSSVNPYPLLLSCRAIVLEALPIHSLLILSISLPSFIPPKLCFC
jgi:hypothetical protein